MRALLATLVLLTFLLLGALPAAFGDPAALFPSLESSDLNGQKVSLPGGLPGEVTVTILGFEAEQKESVESWIRGLRLEGGALPWVVVPVIQAHGQVAEMFINSRLRRAIPAGETRKKILAIYTDKAAFLNALGVSNEHSVQVLLVATDGRILLRVEGSFDAAKGRQILAKMPRCFARSGGTQP